MRSLSVSLTAGLGIGLKVDAKVTVGDDLPKQASPPLSNAFLEGRQSVTLSHR